MKEREKFLVTFLHAYKKPFYIEYIWFLLIKEITYTDCTKTHATHQEKQKQQIV